jgi:hypothetical protein
MEEVSSSETFVTNKPEDHSLHFNGSLRFNRDKQDILGTLRRDMLYDVYRDASLLDF